MTDKVIVTFYKIARCGYYKTGQQDQPEFGQIKDILSELSLWVQDEDKKLRETCPFEIAEGEDGFSTYCFNIHHNPDTGDYLVTLWNELPASNGKLTSVNGDQPVGQAVATLNKVPHNNIPGYPTYFWFVPSKNVLATVQLQYRLNGHQNLVRYLNEFLCKFTKYVVLNEPDAESNHSIAGYCKNPELDAPQKLHGSFRSQIFRNAGEIEYLKANYEKIRKIIRKNSLSLDLQEDRTFGQRMLSWFGAPEDVISNGRSKRPEIKVKYEMDVRLTLDELNAIIDSWSSNHETKWDDVGFMLDKEATPRWLSYSLLRTEIAVKTDRDDAGIVKGVSLLSAITQHRAKLLSALT